MDDKLLKIGSFIAAGVGLGALASTVFSGGDEETDDQGGADQGGSSEAAPAKVEEHTHYHGAEPPDDTQTVAEGEDDVKDELDQETEPDQGETDDA